MRSLLVAVVSLLCAIIGRTDSNKLKIPIGLLYRQGETEVAEALKYGLSKERNLNISFKVFEQEYVLSAQVERRVCTLLNRGIIVLVAPTALYFRDSLASMSNRYHLPIITSSLPETSENNPKFSLGIMASTIRATIEMVRFYGWKSMVYVTNKDTKHKTLETMLKTEGFQLKAIEDFSPDKIVERMTQKEREPLNVILDITLDAAYDVISSYTKRQTPKSGPVHFLLVPPVLDTFWKNDIIETLDLKVTSFSVLEQPTEVSYLKTIDSVLMVDAGKVITTAISRMNHENSSFLTDVVVNNTKKLNNCLINPPLPWVHGLHIARAMKEVQGINGLTGNIQFDFNGRRRLYSLQILEATFYKHYKIGKWSDKTGLTIYEPDTYENDEKRAHRNEHKKLIIEKRRKLIISSILIEPYLMTDETGYSGFCKDLIDMLSKDLKFEYKLKTVEDHEFGRFDNSSRSWKGMIGELVNKKAHMIVAPLTVTSERNEIVAFTRPFQYSGITLLLTREPTKSSAYSSLLLRPYSREIWIFIFVAYLVFGIFLFAINFFISVTSSRTEYHCNGIRKKPQNYRTWPRRIVILVYLIFTIAVVSIYIARLSALTSVEENLKMKQRPLSTMEIFQKSVTTGSPKILLLRDGATMQLLQKDHVSPLFRLYLERVKENPDLLVDSYRNGFYRVSDKSSDYVFMLESPFAEYISRKYCEHFSTTSQTLKTITYSIALRKDTSLKREIDDLLLAYEEDGSLDKLYEKWWDQGCEKDNSIERGGALVFTDMCGVFYLMIAGLVIIAVLCTIQFLRQKYRSRNENPMKKSILS